MDSNYEILWINFIFKICVYFKGTIIKQEGNAKYEQGNLEELKNSWAVKM